MMRLLGSNTPSRSGRRSLEGGLEDTCAGTYAGTRNILRPRLGLTALNSATIGGSLPVVATRVLAPSRAKTVHK
jgi:hypothetical protein